MQLTRVQAILIHYLMVSTPGLNANNTSIGYSDNEDVEILEAVQSFTDKDMRDAIFSEVNTWKMDIFKNLKKNNLFIGEIGNMHPENLIPLLHVLGTWLHAIDALEEHKAAPTVIAAQYQVLPQMVAESLKGVGSIEQIINSILEREQSDYRAEAINQVNANIRRALIYLELPDEKQKTLHTTAWRILYRYMRPDEREIIKASTIGLQVWTTGTCNESLLHVSRKFTVQVLTESTMEDRINDLVQDADRAAQEVADGLGDSSALDHLLEQELRYCNSSMTSGLYEEMQKIVTNAIKDALSYLSFDDEFLRMDELSEPSEMGELFGFNYEEKLTMAQVVHSVQGFFGADSEFEIDDVDLADEDLYEDYENVYYKFIRQ